MTQLLDKLQSASEGSRELDFEFHELITGKPVVKIETPHPGHTVLWDASWDIPNYTTSLDAAVSLLTDGWMIAEMKQCPEKACLQLWCPANPMLGYKFRSRGATPALALCIAVIKSKDAA